MINHSNNHNSKHRNHKKMINNSNNSYHKKMINNNNKLKKI